MDVLKVVFFTVMLAGAHSQNSDEYGQLFPFGSSVGDTSLVTDSLDDNSPPITLSAPYRFYGESENRLFVNTNGILSFRNNFLDYASQRFNDLLVQDTPLIAPFWNDFDITNSSGNGSIFYRQTTDPVALENAESLLQEYYEPASSSNVSLSRLFIATWVGASAYNSPLDGLNTFQVVLASGGEVSFVFFIYLDIQWTQSDNRFTNIGLRNEDGSRTFMVPGALTPNVIDAVETSNVGAEGLYIYRVDLPLGPVSESRIGSAVSGSGNATNDTVSGSGSAVSGSGSAVSGSGSAVSGSGSAVSGSGSAVSGSGSADSGSGSAVSGSGTAVSGSGRTGSQSGSAIGRSGSGSVSPPIVTIGFDREVIRISEGNMRVTATVSVQNGVVTESVYVIASAGPERLQNTAIANVDYVSATIHLEFNQTHTNLSLSIDLIDDNVFEELFEEVGIELFPLSPNVVIATDTVIILIRDNDGLEIGFDPAEYTVFENQTELPLNVRLFSGNVGTYVDLIVTLGNGTTDTAVSGEDFQQLESYQSFVGFSPYDDDLQTITIDILNDLIFERAEYFTVRLTPTLYFNSNPNVTLEPNTAVVNIIDDDAPVTIVIGFAENEYTVAEDQSFVEVTVSVLDGDLDSVEDNVIVELSTSDISQGPLDYISVRTNLTFNLNVEFTNQIRIPILQDEEEELEEDQTFLVQISLIENESLGVIVLDPSEARVTIIDLDSSIECRTGSIRLADRTTIGLFVRGRVEVCVNQTWSTVCNVGWDYRDAVVACNQLQLPSYGAFVLGDRVFEIDAATERGPIGLSNVQCDGTESVLLTCPSEAPDNRCDHSQDAGVVCFAGIRSCSCSRTIECTLLGKVEDEQQGMLVTIADNEFKCSVNFEEEQANVYRAGTIIDETFELDFLSPGSALLLKQLRVLREAPRDFTACSIENTLIQHGDPGTVLSELGIEQLSFVFLNEDGSLGSLRLDTTELQQFALGEETAADSLSSDNACLFQNLIFWLTQNSTFPSSRCRLGSSPQDSLIVRFDIPSPQ